CENYVLYYRGCHLCQRMATCPDQVVSPTSLVCTAWPSCSPRRTSGALSWVCSADLLPGGAQPLAGLHDPLGHPGLGELAPGARVVGLLVAHLAVDLEHAVVVGEHVRHRRTGERVLGVGVDVHLDHPVVHCGGDLLGGGAGAAVEHQVERLVLA